MRLFKKKVPRTVHDFSLEYKINVKDVIWLWVKEYNPTSYAEFNVDINDPEKWIFKLYVCNNVIEKECNAYRFYLAARNNIEDCWPAVKAVLDGLIYEYDAKNRHEFNKFLLKQYLKDK